MSARKSGKAAPTRVRDAAPAKAPREAAKRPGRGVPTRRGVLSPDDERGVPYRGDWPNPLGEKDRRCF